MVEKEVELVPRPGVDRRLEIASSVVVTARDSIPRPLSSVAQRRASVNASQTAPVAPSTAREEQTSAGDSQLGGQPHMQLLGESVRIVTGRHRPDDAVVLSSVTVSSHHRGRQRRAREANLSEFPAGDPNLGCCPASAPSVPLGRSVHVVVK